MTSASPQTQPDTIPDLLDKLHTQLRAAIEDGRLKDPLMVGIHTGGVWVAERLHEMLGLDEPLGRLNIAFYRDDFDTIGLHPQVLPSQLPVEIEDRDIILVDDVLYTGRTIRAAMNELFDYGRPSRVWLAVLFQRNGLELPIAPQAVGQILELGEDAQVKLSGPDPLTASIIHRED